jgi:hypothetical protein
MIQQNCKKSDADIKNSINPKKKKKLLNEQSFFL